MYNETWEIKQVAPTVQQRTNEDLTVVLLGDILLEGIA